MKGAKGWEHHALPCDFWDFTVPTGAWQLLRPFLAAENQPFERLGIREGWGLVGSKMNIYSLFISSVSCLGDASNHVGSSLKGILESDGLGQRGQSNEGQIYSFRPIPSQPWGSQDSLIWSILFHVEFDRGVSTAMLNF